MGSTHGAGAAVFVVTTPLSFRILPSMSNLNVPSFVKMSSYRQDLRNIWGIAALQGRCMLVFINLTLVLVATY
jgi:hypothetical protein